MTTKQKPEHAFSSALAASYPGMGGEQRRGIVGLAIRAFITPTEIRPLSAKWDHVLDEISDAISDSMDMDWTTTDCAKAVVRFLNERFADGDAALAIGEHAFRAGVDSGIEFCVSEGWCSDEGARALLPDFKQEAWTDYEPPEHIKDLA